MTRIKVSFWVLCIGLTVLWVAADPILFHPGLVRADATLPHQLHGHSRHWHDECRNDSFSKVCDPGVPHWRTRQELSVAQVAWYRGTRHGDRALAMDQRTRLAVRTRRDGAGRRPARCQRSGGGACATPYAAESCTIRRPDWLLRDDRPGRACVAALVSISVLPEDAQTVRDSVPVARLSFCCSDESRILDPRDFLRDSSAHGRWDCGSSHHAVSQSRVVHTEQSERSMASRRVRTLEFSRSAFDSRIDGVVTRPVNLRS